MNSCDRISPAPLRPGNGRGELGFTIVELIASLVIMAIVLVLLGSNVRLFAASWDRQSRGLQQTDAMLRGASVLLRDLQSLQRIVHRTPGQPEDEAKLAFVGRRHMVSFVALEPDSSARPGLVLVNYRVERRSAGTKLVRRTAPFDNAAPIEAAVFRDPVIILDDLDDVRFSFRAVEGERTGWRNSWSDPLALPDIVRVRAVNSSGLRYPDIVVRLRADVEQQCITATNTLCSIRNRPTKVGSKANRNGVGQR